MFNIFKASIGCSLIIFVIYQKYWKNGKSGSTFMTLEISFICKSDWADSAFNYDCVIADFARKANTFEYKYLVSDDWTEARWYWHQIIGLLF